MSKWSEDLIAVDGGITLDELFVRRIRRSPDRTAYLHFDKASKTWLETSWAQMGEAVGRWQHGFRGEGLGSGDRVAIQMRNCRRWIQFDQAALGAGLVTVPLYTEDRADNTAFVLRDAGVKLLAIQDVGRWRRLRDTLPEESSLQRVLILDPPADGLPEDIREDDRVSAFDDWLPNEGELARRKGDPHALASIVYTSGTTGRPKGVMLSHHNMISVAHAALKMLNVYAQDRLLSFLPLSHTLERTAGYCLPILTGSQVAFARSVGQLAEDMKTVQPTALICVPRIFEKVYDKLQAKLSKEPRLRRMMFNLAVEAGWRRFRRQQGFGGWHPAIALHKLLHDRVAGKIQEAFGGRLRLAVSGGAALPPASAKMFCGLGIEILQGYGLTETSPVISVNLPEDNDPYSVGVPLRGIEVKLGDDDELLVKTPGRMLGYWNNHAATAGIIDAEGWLHTGDQVRLEKGHVYITGRLKDILVLSNGEKVPPSDMEMAITTDSLIEQVLVVGEARPYLSALVVLNAETWPAFAQGLGLDPMSPASLHNNKVINGIIKRLRDALKDFPGYAKIRRIHLTLEPWTVDNGLATPTMKVKRPKVLEAYAAEVEAMYSDGPAG